MDWSWTTRNKDTMALHPDIEAFLDLANAQDASRTPMNQMSASQARTAYDRSTAALDLPGDEVRVDTLHLHARDGDSIAARVYRGAAGTSPAPVVLFFHGGGYVLGGLESHDSLCRSLALGAACDVLAIDYRRAPEHSFPTAFEDAEDALAWLRLHGAQHGLDAARLVVAGDSVGGTLATALCIAQRQAQLPQPALQVLLYPCTAAWQNSASHERLQKGYLLERETLEWMFKQYLRSDSDRKDWRFAPLEAHDLQGLAPLHLVLAEYDPLLDEGHLYADRLKSAGCQVSVHVYRGMVHDFARLGNITEEADAVRRDVGRVIASAMKHAASPVDHVAS